MEYRKLGKSALNISTIGFGCMSLKPGQPNLQHLVDLAIDHGINYFDTADLYDKGLNEEAIGKALSAKRDDVVIATKVGNQWKPDGSGWQWNPTKSYILQAAEESLKRLKIDHIDLYQLHGGTMDDPIDETIEAFEQLQQQGKIRYYGISSIRPVVIREYIKRSNIVSVMMQYSLLDRRPEEESLKLLHENNIGVLARGTVASGLLVNKPPKEYLGQTAESVQKAAETIRNLAGDQSSASMAIAFALENSAVTSAIVGMHTEQQLVDAIKASQIKISEQVYTNLRQSVPALIYQEHR